MNWRYIKEHGTMGYPDDLLFKLQLRQIHRVETLSKSVCFFQIHISIIKIGKIIFFLFWIRNNQLSTKGKPKKVLLKIISDFQRLWHFIWSTKKYFMMLQKAKCCWEIITMWDFWIHSTIFFTSNKSLILSNTLEIILKKNFKFSYDKFST